jgi:hypothetical protein
MSLSNLTKSSPTPFQKMYQQLLLRLPKQTVKNPIEAVLQLEDMFQVTVDFKTRLVGSKYITNVFFIDRLVHHNRLMGVAEDKNKDSSKTLAAIDVLEKLNTNPKLLHPFVYLNLEHFRMELSK